MLQFNFKIAHYAGSVNTAADSLSRLDLEITEKIRHKIWEGVATKPIEVTTSSSDVADEKQFFFTRADSEDKTEEQTLERKEQLRKNATQWVFYEEPSWMKPSHRKIRKDWRKHYVVLHKRNQNKCTNTSGTRYRSSLEEYKTCITWPAMDNRQTM